MFIGTYSKHARRGFPKEVFAASHQTIFLNDEKDFQTFVPLMLGCNCGRTHTLSLWSHCDPPFLASASNSDLGTKTQLYPQQKRDKFLGRLTAKYLQFLWHWSQPPTLFNPSLSVCREKCIPRSFSLWKLNDRANIFFGNLPRSKWSLTSLVSNFWFCAFNIKCWAMVLILRSEAGVKA